MLIEYDAQSPLFYGTKSSGSPGGGGGTGSPGASGGPGGGGPGGGGSGGGGSGGGGEPTQQHSHTMIRTPNGNDYGIDLMKLHLETDHGSPTSTG